MCLSEQIKLQEVEGEGSTGQATRLFQGENTFPAIRRSEHPRASVVRWSIRDVQPSANGPSPGVLSQLAHLRLVTSKPRARFGNRRAVADWSIPGQAHNLLTASSR